LRDRLRLPAPETPYRLGQAEVEHLHRAVLAYLDVGRLQVAVDDPLLVRRLERFGHLPGDRQRLLDRDRSLADPVGERRPFDQFHHERGHARALLQPVDGGDVGVVQRGQRARLPVEPRQSILILCHRLRQDLDGHGAAQVGVGGAVHLTHATDTDLRGNLVRTDSGTRGQRHAARNSSTKLGRKGGAARRNNNSGKKGAPIPTASRASPSRVEHRY
jgi:hypothetical protein